MCNNTVDVFSGRKGDQYEFRLNYSNGRDTESIVVLVDLQVNGQVSARNLEIVSKMFKAAYKVISKKDMTAKVNASYANAIRHLTPVSA